MVEQLERRVKRLAMEMVNVLFRGHEVGWIPDETFDECMAVMDKVLGEAG